MIVVAAIVFVAIAAWAIMASIRVDRNSRVEESYVERLVHGDLEAACRSAEYALLAREQLVR